MLNELVTLTSIGDGYPDRLIIAAVKPKRFKVSVREAARTKLDEEFGNGEEGSATVFVVDIFKGIVYLHRNETRTYTFTAKAMAYLRSLDDEYTDEMDARYKTGKAIITSLQK